MVRYRSIQVMHWTSHVVLVGCIAIGSPCHAQNAAVPSDQAQAEAAQPAPVAAPAPAPVAAPAPAPVAAPAPAQPAAAQADAVRQEAARQAAALQSSRPAIARDPAALRQATDEAAQRAAILRAKIQDAAFPAARPNVAIAPDYMLIEQREKHFLMRLFKLTDQQRDKLDQLDVAKLAAHAVEEQRAGAMRTAARVVPLTREAAQKISNSPPPVLEDPHAFLVLLREKYSTILTSKQWVIYQAECDARDRFMRRANAESMAIFLAEQLQLSKEQMSALIEEFAGLPIMDGAQVSAYLQNQNVTLPLPEAVVAKHLNSEQTLLFNKLRLTGRNRTVNFDELGAIAQ